MARAHRPGGSGGAPALLLLALLALLAWSPDYAAGVSAKHGRGGAAAEKRHVARDKRGSSRHVKSPGMSRAMEHEGGGERTHGRRLTQAFAETVSDILQLLDTEFLEGARQIADTSPANYGHLSPDHLRSLHKSYKQLMESRMAGGGNDWVVLDCNNQSHNTETSYNVSTSYTGLLMENCANTTLEVFGNVTIQYALLYNNSHGDSLVEVSEGSTLWIANSVFLGNAGYYTSGIWAYESVNLEATGLIMHGNAQRKVYPLGNYNEAPIPSVDSGLYVSGGCMWNLTDSLFIANGVGNDDNPLVSGGAAITLRGSSVTDDDDLTSTYSCSSNSTNVTMRSNYAQFGGAVWAESLERLTIINSYFTNNHAAMCGSGWPGQSSVGGAMVLTNINRANLRGNEWNGNSACRSGGAVSFSGSLMTVTSDMVTDNAAHTGVGGAFFVTGEQGFRSWFATYTNNTAGGSGGALYILGGASIIMQGNTFSSNRAEELGGGLVCSGCRDMALFADRAPWDEDAADYYPSYFYNNTAGSGGAAFIEAGTLGLSNTTFEKNSARIGMPAATQCSTKALGAGGALCIHARRVNEAELADKGGKDGTSDEDIVGSNGITESGLYIYSCGFYGSRATNGGAMLVHHECAVGADDCRPLGLEDLAFYNNRAVKGSGHDIWTTQPDELQAYCDDSTEYEDPVPSSLCPGWFPPYNTSTASGTALPLVTTPALAAPAKHLSWMSRNSSAPLSQLLSSTSTPMRFSIDVNITDHFNSSVTSGTEDSKLVVSVAPSGNTSKGIELIGKAVVAAQRGVARFDDLAVKAAPGSYDLTFYATNELGEDMNTTMPVVVRTCRVGEVTVPAGNECNVCLGGTFSFNQRNTTCDACPEDAMCDYPGKAEEQPSSGPIGAVVVPELGSWQSSPRSPQIHGCPFSGACTGNNASDTNRTELVAYQKALVLDNAPINITYYQQLQCAEGHTGNLCANCEEGWGHKGEGRCVKCASLAASIVLVTVAICIRIGAIVLQTNAELVAFDDDSDDEDDMPHADVARGQSRHSFKSVLKKKFKFLMPRKHSPTGEVRAPALEVPEQPAGLSDEDVQRRMQQIFASDGTALKILQNFLQIVGATEDVTLYWPAAISRTFDMATTVSTGMNFWASPDCVMTSDASRKSVQQVLFSVFSPIVMLLLAAPSWALVHRIFYKNNPHVPFRTYLGNRIRVTGLVIGFVFYPDLLETFFSIFNCTTLDVPDVPYWENGQAVGTYWNSDFDMVCYQGSHLALALAVGVAGLVLVCAGFPVASGLFLWRNKPRHTVFEFARSYSFLYSEYKERYYFWESVVMARKLAIVAVVVFIDGSRPVLKLLVVFAIVLIGLLASLICRPFRERRMAWLDAISHLGNAVFVWLLMLLFGEKISNTSKEAITIVLATFTACLVAYMVIQFIREWLLQAMREMDHNNDGVLAPEDLIRPHADFLHKFKLRVMHNLLCLAAHLPRKLALYLVLYPCEYLGTPPPAKQAMSMELPPAVYKEGLEGEGPAAAVGVQERVSSQEGRSQESDESATGGTEPAAAQADVVLSIAMPHTANSHSNTDTGH